jgi:hypothetical protein
LELLERVLSDETEREIVRISASLSREVIPYRWFFLLKRPVAKRREDAIKRNQFVNVDHTFNTVFETNVKLAAVENFDFNDIGKHSS